MRFVLRLLVVLIATSPLLGAQHSLLHARRAQALLGPAVWSDVIRIENESPRSRYPRALHGLVFELAGMLWFYTASEGTQGFSLHHGRLAEEKADYGPLLRDIEPGFTRWESVAAEPIAPDFAAALPNGCFIESMAAWRLHARTGDAREPRLLSYYVAAGGWRRGHTVLTFRRDDGLFVIDPANPDSGGPRLLDIQPDAQPLAVARALEPRSTKAHLIPIDFPPLPTGTELLAAREERDERDGNLRPTTLLR